MQRARALLLCVSLVAGWRLAAADSAPGRAREDGAARAGEAAARTITVHGAAELAVPVECLRLRATLQRSGEIAEDVWTTLSAERERITREVLACGVPGLSVRSAALALSPAVHMRVPESSTRSGREWRAGGGTELADELVVEVVGLSDLPRADVERTAARVVDAVQSAGLQPRVRPEGGVCEVEPASDPAADARLVQAAVEDARRRAGLVVAAVGGALGAARDVRVLEDGAEAPAGLGEVVRRARVEVAFDVR